MTCLYQWRESEVKWASRWDVYLSMNHAVPDKVHWFSIVNSILIVLFLAFMVAMILFRALHRDISKYNRVSDLKNIVTTPLVDLTIIL
jgi:transmembrane 9 superfamily member 2/4